MAQRYEPNSNFKFEELTMSKPLSASTGTYISKYSIQENPVYIQPPKCTVKQIVVKTGKRMYCDLVFHQENEQFIQWMENLENKSQQLIYQNREKWFQTELEMDDIENSFTSPMKVYKSGKSYIVRTNISTRLGKPILKIYNEDEKDVSYDNIVEGTNVMAILEFQGIRCSARSFQIDIEIKQLMVLKSYDLFTTCILKKKPLKESEPSYDSSFTLEKEPDLTKELDVPKESDFTKELDVTNESDLTKESSLVEEPSLVEESYPIDEVLQIATDQTDLCEVEFDLDEMPESDTISLKKRNDVYYEMYKEARQKAKVARDLALSAYLEAKRIKNTYMLDDIIDSSDDEDEEDDEDDEEDDQENDEENDEEDDKK